MADQQQIQDQKHQQQLKIQQESHQQQIEGLMQKVQILEDSVSALQKEKCPCQLITPLPSND